MSQEGRMITLSAAGLDAPGLVSFITTRIYEMGGNIIDVEENCRRGLFSIFLIVDFSGAGRPMEEVVELLNAMEAETGLKMVVGVYDAEEIRCAEEREGHVVTVLGEDRPGVIAKVSTLLHQHNVNIETCRMIARGQFFSMELSIDTGRIRVEPGLSRHGALELMKIELKDLCRDLNQSVVIQSEDLYRKGKKLVVFDVESTLIGESSLESFMTRIQAEKGLVRDKEPDLPGEKRESMEGLVEHARRLKGIPMKEFERFGEILQANAETLELIRILKSMGFKIALLSSGFSFFVKKIFEAAGVDYAFSNTLKVDEEGIITGELEEPLIVGATKGEILRFIMEMENLLPEQVIAVGNGTIGSHFIADVGLSIAFRPERMSIKTDGVLSSDQITAMLYCLGIPGRELEKLLGKEGKE
ncbi:MAG: HAD-IB family phosphatase [Deltaproteobacteria bacterium]|nr:HAD-IB family phosphatase [Deltaproteobacteria bacterium]